MIDKKLIAYFEKQDSSFISDAFVKYVDHELEMLRYMMLENHGISGIDSTKFNLWNRVTVIDVIYEGVLSMDFSECPECGSNMTRNECDHDNCIHLVWFECGNMIRVKCDIEVVGECSE